MIHFRRKLLSPTVGARFNLVLLGENKFGYLLTDFFWRFFLGLRSWRGRTAPGPYHDWHRRRVEAERGAQVKLDRTERSFRPVRSPRVEARSLALESAGGCRGTPAARAPAARRARLRFFVFSAHQAGRR